MHVKKFGACKMYTANMATSAFALRLLITGLLATSWIGASRAMSPAVENGRWCVFSEPDALMDIRCQDAVHSVLENGGFYRAVDPEWPRPTLVVIRVTARLNLNSQEEQLNRQRIQALMGAFRRGGVDTFCVYHRVEAPRYYAKWKENRIDLEVFVKAVDAIPPDCR